MSTRIPAGSSVWVFFSSVNAPIPRAMETFLSPNARFKAQHRNSFEKAVLTINLQSCSDECMYSICDEGFDTFHAVIFYLKIFENRILAFYSKIDLRPISGPRAQTLDRNVTFRRTKARKIRNRKILVWLDKHYRSRLLTEQVQTQLKRKKFELVATTLLSHAQILSSSSFWNICFILWSTDSSEIHNMK